MFDSMISDHKFENISMLLLRPSSNAILRSKWEAWTSFNGISQDKAMTDFIDLIQSIQSKFSEEHNTTMVSRPLPAVPYGSNITDSRRESLIISPIQPTGTSSASSSTINHNQSISSQQQQQQQQQVISSTALTNSINNFQYLLIALLLPVFLFYLIGGSGRGVSFIIGIIIIIKYLLYKYHLGTPMRKSKNSNIPAPLVPIPRGRTLVRMPIDLGPILRFLDVKKKKEAVVVVVDTSSSSSSTATASTSSSSAVSNSSSSTTTINANNGNNNGVVVGGGAVKKHDITISHLVLKACAATIAEISSLNGYVMGSGDFYPAKKQGVDLSLSLDISDKDTVLLKIDDADMKSIDTITNEISYRSKVLRDECKVGMKQQQQQKQTLRTRLLDYLSPTIAEVMDIFLTRLGTVYGLHIPALDILPFPSGVCAVITSPSVEGDMDVDVMFVPSYSTSDFNSSDLASSYNIPIIVSIGSMRVLPALDAQQKQITGTHVLNCSISIDNCAANMTEVRRFCAKLQKFLKDPSLLEGRDKKNITASK